MDSSVLGTCLDRAGGRIEPLLHDRVKKSAELTGNITDNDGRNHSTFTNAVDTVEEDKGKNNCGSHHAYIDNNFYTASFFPGDLMQSGRNAFARQHDHIGCEFHGYAEGEDQTADQETDNFHQILLRIQPVDQVFHGKINKISEKDGDRNLKELDRLIVLPEQDELKRNQEKAEQNGKSAERHGVLQAQNIWDAGDGRSTEAGIGDKGNPQGIDKKPDDEVQIFFEKRHMTHRNLLKVENYFFMTDFLIIKRSEQNIKQKNP